MELRYYIDWCPTSTLPIQNKVLSPRGFARPLPPEMRQTKTDEIFRSFPALRSYEYAVRLDGLFIFRIEYSEGANDQDKLEISREISDHIKNAIGHVHEFHSFPYSRARQSDLARGVLQRIAGIVDNLLSRFQERKLSLFSSSVHEVLDVDLHVAPVEIEDPFCEAFVDSTGKRFEFERLDSVISPIDEGNIGQLRVKMDGGDGGGNLKERQRACLRLRDVYSRKKDICLIAHKRKRNWSSSSKVPGIISSILGALSFILMMVVLDIGWKTSLAVGVALWVGVFTILDYKRNSPVLEILQKTIGFYTYANTYSLLIDGIYGLVPDTCGIHVGERHFDNLIESLKARLMFEKQIVDRRKYLLAVSFATLTTMVALVKLVAEMEKYSPK